jgi:GT2 family glycosyltransferase/2-polyprenyl-3-methyl-5-hydroxy-6-metoxy-1,4-benzoquinol methylase
MDDHVVRSGNSIAPVSQAAIPRDREYGSEYFDTYGRLGPCTYTRENPHWLKFFGHIADEIVRRLSPRLVLDVGCAKGFLVECLRDRGVEAYGLDVSEFAISEVRPDIKPYCWVGSVQDSISKDYNLITCIEVCEHLSEADARDAVREMTAHADSILFSSTPSDFTEPTHVNVHPIIDWLRLFAEFSFAPDQTFDAGFICPQAMLLRRTQTRPSDQDLCRFASLKNQAIARAEMKDSPEISALRQELNLIHNSKGWRFLNLYRTLRFRVKHPLVQLIEQLRNLTDRHLSYEYWIKHVEQPAYDVGAIARSISDFHYKPKISVIMPVYNTPTELLDFAIRSVRIQHYENWELCICDDASPDDHVRLRLMDWQRQDSRIKVTFSSENEGISGASNRALQLASGEFVGLMDHDDELSRHALYEVVKLLQGQPQADMIYSDEDRLDRSGRRVWPFFKPDWSPEYMLACMYTCHFGVYRKRLLDEIAGFRVGFEGSQDYDLVLRVSEKTKSIHHIPRVLYHWRMIDGSAAASAEAKPYAYEAAKKALHQHLQRQQISADVVDGNLTSHYRIRFNPTGTDKVSIVILASGKRELLRTCITSIETKTSYPNYEILIVDKQSAPGELRREFLSRSHRVLPFEGPFNSSRLVNLCAKETDGDYLLLLHGDAEVISEDWIASMLGLCQQKEIGVVGAKLLYRNDLIEHAGIVLGLKGVAGRPLRNFPRNTRCGFDIVSDMRNCSAVSAACMMVRKETFEEVGGFAEGLSAAHNDIDFCLRVREAGYRIVWTPWAELYHRGCLFPDVQRASREVKYLKDRWGKILANDPYYNPNLTLQHEDYGFRV